MTPHYARIEAPLNTFFSKERGRTTVQNILKRAEGFMDTGDQERFDECESVMSDLLRSIRSSASDWKVSRVITRVPLAIFFPFISTSPAPFHFRVTRVEYFRAHPYTLSGLATYFTPIT